MRRRLLGCGEAACPFSRNLLLTAAGLSAPTLGQFTHVLDSLGLGLCGNKPSSSSEVGLLAASMAVVGSGPDAYDALQKVSIHYLTQAVA